MEDLPGRWDRTMGAELGAKLSLLQVKRVVCVHHLVMALHKRRGLWVEEGFKGRGKGGGGRGMAFQGLFKDVQDVGSNVLVNHRERGWCFAADI